LTKSVKQERNKVFKKVIVKKVVKPSKKVTKGKPIRRIIRRTPVRRVIKKSVPRVNKKVIRKVSKAKGKVAVLKKQLKSAPKGTKKNKVIKKKLLKQEVIKGGRSWVNARTKVLRSKINRNR
jgi:hypothetical protein